MTIKERLFLVWSKMGWKSKSVLAFLGFVLVVGIFGSKPPKESAEQRTPPPSEQKPQVAANPQPASPPSSPKPNPLPQTDRIERFALLLAANEDCKLQASQIYNEWSQMQRKHPRVRLWPTFAKADREIKKYCLPSYACRKKSEPCIVAAAHAQDLKRWYQRQDLAPQGSQ